MRKVRRSYTLSSRSHAQYSLHCLPHSIHCELREQLSIIFRLLPTLKKDVGGSSALRVCSW
jgi:hypothetical protein